MLIIRKEQMDALGAEMLKGFHRRMVAHLRTLFPTKTPEWDETTGNEFVVAGTAKAGVHQVKAERDVARFVDLMLELGNDFESRPDMAWVKPLLADREMGGTGKMNAIYRELATRVPSAAWLCAAWPDGDQ